MINNNIDFITSIFNDLVKIKPKLSYFLPKDDDDDDYDIRKLANEIISNFPWPIGIELRRLLSANMNSLNRGRLDQIFRTFEKTLQFVSFVMIAQLYEEHINQSIQIPQKFKFEFTKRVSALSMGSFSWLIRGIGEIFKENDIELFIPNMTSILNNKFYNELDSWIPERNEIGHYRIVLSDEEIEVRCGEYILKLKEIISSLSFLINYPLLSVTEIQVKKTKRTPVQYDHKMLLLNSASSDFAGKNRVFSSFTDSQSVMLVHNLKTAHQKYLALSPFIVDTHFETIDSREKLRNVRKDVYMYTKWNQKSNQLYYAGTVAEEKSDMRLVSFYDRLLTEYAEITQALGSI
jgi:hypothetical protein